MAKLLLALAAAALLSGPVSAGPEREAAAPAAPSARPAAVAPVPALGLALAETGSPTGLEAAPAEQSPIAAASEAARTESSALQPAAAVRQARPEPAPAQAADAAGETLAAAENARFDHAASASAAVDAPAMPIAARMRALVPSDLRPVVRHPILLGRARIELAEKAAREAGGISLVAAVPLGLLLLGGVGLTIMVVMAPFATAAPRARPLTLEEAERRALEERVRARLVPLVERLGLPAASAPRIELSNDLGRHNMSVRGRRISPEATIHVGEDWAGYTDEEMDGVLAHELGHLHRRDGAKDWANARGLSNLLGLWAVGLAPLGGALAIADRVDPQALSAVDLALGGWSMSAASPALLGLFLAATVGGGALLLGASRLRERLADDHAARLVGASGLIAYFERQSRKPAKLWERLRARFWGTHPRLAARLRYLRRR